MKNVILFLLVSTLFFACKKEMTQQEISVQKIEANLEMRAENIRYVQMACAGYDANGVLTAGIKCVRGDGNCIRELLCTSVVRDRSSSNEEIAHDFVNRGIEEGLFYAEGYDEIVETTIESLEANP